MIDCIGYITMHRDGFGAQQLFWHAMLQQQGLMYRGDNVTDYKIFTAGSYKRMKF